MSGRRPWEDLDELDRLEQDLLQTRETVDEVQQGFLGRH